MIEHTFGGRWRAMIVPFVCTAAVVGIALTFAMMS